MRSIRQKVTILTAIAILMVAVIAGGTSVYTIKQMGNHDSAQILELTCEKEAAIINERLLNTEGAVQILADYALERLFSVEKLVNDVAYRDSYTVQLANLFGNIAQNVPGAMSYYVRYNPDIMPSDSGLYYRKESLDEDFSFQNPTDIKAYDPDDSGWVGWWYIPVANGAPTWMMPYYDEGSGKYLISYVIPLYEGDVLIGIAGMDLDYHDITNDVSRVKCYDTGYACLAGDDGIMYYDPAYEDVTPIADMDLSGDVALDGESSGGTPITYRLSGVEKKMSYHTLNNGMKLIITAPVSEIDSLSNRMIRQSIISTIIVLVTFFLLTLMLSRRITKPLNELAEAARQINEGNLEVTFPKETNDEVGELAHVMNRMVNHLKHHIDDLNSLAFHDSLTGVKNKTAYDDAAAKLDAKEGEKEYGLVVLDANNLKVINDTYGHERGNIYLQNACRLTCRIFKGSPVYRIGGDEFVVLLQGDDYDNCYKLLRDFDIEAEKHNLETDNDWEKINIAKGMVKYDPGIDDCVESVFKRADARMYEAKQKMKLADMG